MFIVFIIWILGKKAPNRVEKYKSAQPKSLKKKGSIIAVIIIFVDYVLLPRHSMLINVSRSCNDIWDYEMFKRQSGLTKVN